MIKSIEEKFNTIYGYYINAIPSLQIKPALTDKYVTWKAENRLDLLSKNYYGNPFGTSYILIANRHLGVDEDFWELNTTIRIPYPLDSAIERLNNELENFINININEA